MLFRLIFLVSFDQYFFQFYYKIIILSKIAKFQVRSFEKKNLYQQKAYKKQYIRHYYGYTGL